MPVWCADQAGPYQAIPQEGQSWQPVGEPQTTPHEYIRNGTTKILTLFHPQTGQVQVEGTDSCTNLVLHDWFKRELTDILAKLSKTDETVPTLAERKKIWAKWQEGLTKPITLPEEVPVLRMLLVLDNLAGHKNVEFVLWLVSMGVMPLYTPLGGSWLNMAESIQRLLKRRALNGQSPSNPAEIVKWFEEVAAHWNKDPTAFVWGGKRRSRRERQKQRRHEVGGSGARTRRPIRGHYGYRRGR